MRKNQIINITLSEELLDAVDKQAEVEIRNRSELIREAVRTYLLEKNANEIHQTFTPEEVSRVNDIKNFSDFKDFTTFAISSSFRPQPNEVKDLFAGGESELTKYIENPASFRNMGWDLRTLGRAKPVAGEYLQITNGDRKIIRIFRDGQVIFAASEDFYGHGIENNDPNKPFIFNGFAAAELISNFVNFTSKISEHLAKKPSGIIYKIHIFKPERKIIELVLDINWISSAGRLDFLGPAVDRDVFIKKDGQTPEMIAYKIWAEFCYIFGITEDHFWFVNKQEKTMDFNTFINQK